VSTTATTLHGVQLWVALPDGSRDVPRTFEHHVPDPLAVPGGMLRVFLGSLAGVASPVRTCSPIIGAEVVLDPGARLELDVDPAYEHGLLVDTGSIGLESTVLVRGELGYTGVGAARLTLEDLDGTGSRAVLIGGAPFGEEIVMWWNFVARTHDEIVGMREQWNARTERFGDVAGYAGTPSWLPAPDLPHVVLRPRVNAPNVVSA